VQVSFFRILGASLFLFCLSIAKAQAVPQSCAEGDRLLGKAQYSQAVKAYNTCLREAPDHINGYFNRAGAYTGLKQYPQAIADYDKVLKQLPLDSEAYYNRGSLYRLLKNKSQSTEDFRIATELSPENKKYQQALIEAYLYAQESQKALSHLNQLLASEANMEWYLQRGALYKNMGNFSKAFNDFGVVLQKDASHSEAWFQRGLTYFKSKQYPQAVYDFSQAIKNNPKMPLAYYNRGLAYQNQNKCSLAQQDFRRACQLGDKLACQHKCKP
jgi:tetratricopeptide (TPR) repeat protein